MLGVGGDFGKVLLHDDDLKQGREGIPVDIGVVDHAVKPGVPVSHHREEGEGGQHRRRKGQHDGPEYPQPPGAVHCRGFLQFLGDAAEEVDEQDDRPDVDRTRQHQRKDGVDELQLCVERVVAGGGVPDVVDVQAEFVEHPVVVLVVVDVLPLFELDLGANGDGEVQGDGRVIVEVPVFGRLRLGRFGCFGSGLAAA